MTDGYQRARAVLERAKMKTHALLALPLLAILEGCNCSPGVPLPDGGNSECIAAATTHLASDAACRTTRGAGQDDGSDAGPFCNRDSDCTHGINGRCGRFGNGSVTCSYDVCFKNEDCDGGQTCLCGDGSASVLGANRCVVSNCRVDSDCGDSCSCSPTYDTMCGSRDGYAGVYCHAPSDDCTNDEDCRTRDGGSSFAYCAFNGEVNRWVCYATICSG